MDVVGDIDGDLDGDLDGEVMGDLDGEVMGDEVVGIVRRSRRTGRMSIIKQGPGKARALQLPQRPDWRRQLAPGVIQPDEGMYVLPMNPLSGNPVGTFTNAISTITYEGQLQKPYRAERLLVGTSKTIAGSASGPRLLGVLYVGTDLQQAEIQGWDVELVGQANSFGTRLTCKAAEPGVKIRLVVTLSSNLTSSDTIFLSCQFLGRVIA
jgi:hypothetical protein